MRIWLTTMIRLFLIESVYKMKISNYYCNINESEKIYVKCLLCPRECLIKTEETGFCGVRKNIGGELYNINWGIIVPPVIKSVGTNAIYMIDKDEMSLGIGSIGCNLNCDYCQSWKYTHDNEFDSDDFDTDVEPEDIVKIALDYGLKYISFTFNDPISIFDYVVEVARLARKYNIKTIFKSNMYLNENPVRELVDCIDIFSISIKSIRKEFYLKYCGNVDLEIVLRNTKFVYQSERHLEISNLICPYSKSDNDVRDLAIWIRDSLSINVPLHVVKYHPENRMKGVIETEEVYKLSEIAKKYLRNVFVGNV